MSGSVTELPSRLDGGIRSHIDVLRFGTILSYCWLSALFYCDVLLSHIFPSLCPCGGERNKPGRTSAEAETMANTNHSERQIMSRHLDEIRHFPTALLLIVSSPCCAIASVIAERPLNLPELTKVELSTLLPVSHSCDRSPVLIDLTTDVSDISNRPCLGRLR
jgi:hypothetical protein